MLTVCRLRKLVYAAATASTRWRRRQPGVYHELTPPDVRLGTWARTHYDPYLTARYSCIHHLLDPCCEPLH